MDGVWEVRIDLITTLEVWNFHTGIIQKGVNAMQKISFDELIKIEQSIAKNSARPSLCLQDRISPQEKVILCAYHTYKILFIRDVVEFVILTDYKIIVSNTLDELNYKEIMLDNKLIRAGIDLGIINLYYEGGSPHGEILTKSIKSQKLAELWVSEINNAISQAKVRVRAGAGNSASTSSKNETIADQIQKLSELHQAGILTDEEFAKAKQRVIGF
jgi:hypothetical protein